MVRQKWLNIVKENKHGCIAVHCIHGLGRSVYWCDVLFECSFVFALEIDRRFLSPWPFAKPEWIHRNQSILFARVVVAHSTSVNWNSSRIINRNVAWATNTSVAFSCNPLRQSCLNHASVFLCFVISLIEIEINQNLLNYRSATSSSIVNHWKSGFSPRNRNTSTSATS